MSYQFENFVDNYVNKLNKIIYEHIYESESENYEGKDLIDKFSNHRKKVSYFLLEEGLSADYLTNNPKIIKELKKQLRNIYKGDILNNDNIDDFINVMFLNVTEITQNEINKYGQNIINYNISQDINDLYNFQFLSIGDKNNISDTEQDEFKRLFQESLEGLKVKDKAEFLANLNIFFEEYLQTEIGQKEIGLIFSKFKEHKNIDPEEAKRNWVEDLINVAVQSSPMSNEIDIEQGRSLQIQVGTASKGLFDGLFFIDKTKLTEEESGRLKEIDSLDKLDKFKKNLTSIKQIQISATADKGVDVEGNSVMRHALANTVIATTLNSHWINSGDTNFLDLFSRKEKGLQENNNIRNAIITAFRAEYPGIISNIENNLSKNEREEQQKFIFEKLQRQITENPDNFIRQKIQNIDESTVIEDKHIKEYFNLNKKQIELLRKQKSTSLNEEINVSINEEIEELKKRKSGDKDDEVDKQIEELISNRVTVSGEVIDELYPHLKADLIFEHKNYFSVYLSNSLSRKRELEVDKSFDNPLNELEKHEIVLLMHYSAIVKQKTYNQINEFSLSAAQEYFNQSCEVRGLGANLKFDNEKLSQLNITIEDIDRFAIHNFLLSDNAKNNVTFFDSSTRDNFSIIIESNLKNKNIDNLYNNDSNFSKDSLHYRIKELKNTGIFSLKYKQNITLISEQQEALKEQKEALKEKELLSKYEKIISNISAIENLGYNIQEGGYDYKLNKIIKEHNTTAKIIDDNDQVKDFLNKVGIDWKNKSFENAINEAYNNFEIENSQKNKEQKSNSKKQKNGF